MSLIFLLCSFIDYNKQYVCIVEDKLNISINNSKTRIIKDLNDDEYALIECPKSYYIYSIKYDIVTEYSLTCKSPYFNINTPIYCGPNSYFAKNNDIIYNINDGSLLNNTKINSLIINNSQITNYSYHYDAMVKHPNFFKEDLGLHCGDKDNYIINNGDCGYIALGMLIAYADKFKNDNVMDDVYYYDSFNKIGLSAQLRDYLKFLNPKDGTIYTDIMNTMKEYAKLYKLELKHYSRWTPFYTNDHLVSTIRNDIPIIVFENFSTSIGQINKHAIVAYGADIEIGQLYFRCHLGWDPTDETNKCMYSDIHVHSSLIGSIYYFNLL